MRQETQKKGVPSTLTCRPEDIVPFTPTERGKGKETTMGAIASREMDNTISSLRYGNHEIALIPLLHTYFGRGLERAASGQHQVNGDHAANGSSSQQLRQQFIRLRNDPSVRYHFMRPDDRDLLEVPSPTYTEKDLDHLLDVVEDAMFDTHEDLMQAAQLATVLRSFDALPGGNGAPTASPSTSPAPVTGATPTPFSTTADSYSSTVSGLEQQQPVHTCPEGGAGLVVTGQNRDPTTPSWDATSSTFTHTTATHLTPDESQMQASVRSADSDMQRFAFPWVDIEGDDAVENTTECAPGTNKDENALASATVATHTSGSDTLQESVLDIHEDGPRTPPLEGSRGSHHHHHSCSPSPTVGDTPMPTSNGANHFSTTGYPLQHYFVKNAEVEAGKGCNTNDPSADSLSPALTLQGGSKEMMLLRRRYKRAMRPVPCAVAFVYVNGREIADCFTFFDRKVNLIGFFGCRTHEGEADDDVPYLQTRKAVLKAAGDRTLDRIIALAARLYYEQFTQVTSLIRPHLDPQRLFSECLMEMPLVTSTSWNSYPALKFLHDTVALTWAMEELAVHTNPPTLSMYTHFGEERRVCAHFSGALLARMWLWSCRLLRLHMHRGRWVQYTLDDLAQRKDHTVAHWLATNPNARTFLGGKAFTERLTSHLGALHKEILRARETPQDDYTLWVSPHVPSHDGKVYRVFRSPECGPFLTTVRVSTTPPAGGGPPQPQTRAEAKASLHGIRLATAPNSIAVAADRSGEGGFIHRHRRGFASPRAADVLRPTAEDVHLAFLRSISPADSSLSRGGLLPHCYSSPGLHASPMLLTTPISSSNPVSPHSPNPLVVSPGFTPPTISFLNNNGQMYAQSQKQAKPLYTSQPNQVVPHASTQSSSLVPHTVLLNDNNNNSYMFFVPSPAPGIPQASSLQPLPVQQSESYPIMSAVPLSQPQPYAVSGVRPPEQGPQQTLMRVVWI